MRVLMWDLHPDLDWGLWQKVAVLAIMMSQTSLIGFRSRDGCQSVVSMNSSLRICWRTPQTDGHTHWTILWTATGRGDLMYQEYLTVSGSLWLAHGWHPSMDMSLTDPPPNWSCWGVQQAAGHPPVSPRLKCEHKPHLWWLEPHTPPRSLLEVTLYGSSSFFLHKGIK